LFFHLIDIAVANSFILFQRYRAEHSEVEALRRQSKYSVGFREALVRQIVVGKNTMTHQHMGIKLLVIVSLRQCICQRCQSVGVNVQSAIKRGGVNFGLILIVMLHSAKSICTFRQASTVVRLDTLLVTWDDCANAFGSASGQVYIARKFKSVHICHYVTDILPQHTSNIARKVTMLLWHTSIFCVFLVSSIVYFLCNELVIKF
jgi:hypothetical protein